MGEYGCVGAALTLTLSHKNTASAPSVVRQIGSECVEYRVKGRMLLGME